MASPITYRSITDDEHVEFVHAIHRGFGHSSADADLADFLPTHEIDRNIVAIDDSTRAASKIVGTSGSNSFRMTVPGGANVPVSGITAVTVRPTHRRKGILTNMMRGLLDQAVDRNEPIAVLLASESAIYGRFGFGAAITWHGLTINTDHAAFREPFVDSGQIDHIAPAEAIEITPEFWDRYCTTMPGELAMRPKRWSGMFSDLPSNREGKSERFILTHRDANGTLDGMAWYRLEPKWTTDGLAHGIVHVDDGPFAVTDQAHAALWRALLDIDLMTTVTSTKGRADDPIRWRLANPRALRTSGVSDGLWIRILDVPTALQARTYERDGTVTLDVEDDFQADVTGTYRLTVTDGVATCAAVERTDADARNVSIGIAELGSIYLGGVRAVDLARAGRLHASDAETLDRVDALFATRQLPHSAIDF